MKGFSDSRRLPFSNDSLPVFSGWISWNSGRALRGRVERVWDTRVGLCISNSGFVFTVGNIDNDMRYGR